MEQTETTTEIKPGIYKNMPFAEYLAIPAFHKSMVAPALRTTAHLHHYIETHKDPTKAMRFGTLVDCLLLEPEIFDTEFTEQPITYIHDKTGEEKKWSNNANVCKAWNEEQKIQNVTIYSKSDYDNALIMLQKVEDHKTASQWLDGGENQVTMVWQDEETGIMCKSRIDTLKPDMLIDLKTTGNASPSEFKRTVNNFMYHVQDAMYSEGYSVLHDGEMLPFGFVVIESESPFCVATYILGNDTRMVGHSIFRRAIKRYKDYLENGATGYSQLSEELEIPGWAINLEDEEFDESLLGDAS